LGNKPTCDWAIIRPTSFGGLGLEHHKEFFDMVISKVFPYINKGCTKTFMDM
jgi:hypothetical protein